jgi:hypothetical protein
METGTMKQSIQQEKYWTRGSGRIIRYGIRLYKEKKVYAKWGYHVNILCGTKSQCHEVGETEKNKQIPAQNISSQEAYCHSVIVNSVYQAQAHLEINN